MKHLDKLGPAIPCFPHPDIFLYYQHLGELLGPLYLHAEGLKLDLPAFASRDPADIARHYDA
jgi:hypothetical protein